jgi:sigma-E factor negative regulatory protein RseA
MSSLDKETLSAMLDNEANEFEVRRVLQQLQNDPELAGTWQRMNLVQAVLHDDNVRESGFIARPDQRLSRAVARTLAGEPVPAPSRVRRQWAQPLARLSIAASVAVAFFVGMQVSVERQGSSTDNAVPLASQTGSGLPAAQDGGQPAPVTGDLADAGRPAPQVREVNPEARQRLENYIRSVSITREEPQQLEQLQDSPLYRLVNEIKDLQ